MDPGRPMGPNQESRAEEGGGLSGADIQESTAGLGDIAGRATKRPVAVCKYDFDGKYLFVERHIRSMV